VVGWLGGGREVEDERMGWGNEDGRLGWENGRGNEGVRRGMEDGRREA